MSDSEPAPVSARGPAVIESRLQTGALIAVAMALVALHVAGALLRDLPIWDEANCLRWGRHYLADGTPLSLAQSPGYSLLLGVLSSISSPVSALRIAAVGSTLAFSAAIGSIAYVVWRTSTARWLATALALGSAHSYSTIGVHRTSIAILLIGAISLTSRRERVGHAVFLLCALGAYLFRPEVAWAVPFLPLAIWRLAPDSRPDSRTLRQAYIAGLAVLAIAGTLYAAHGGANRNWLAFEQHYALYRRAQLTNVLGPSFSPWLDFERIIAMDFPGARSPIEALHIAPGLVLRFMLANAKAAASMAFASMAASPRSATLVFATVAMIGTLAILTRPRTKTEWRGLGWFLFAMGATSAIAIEVVSNSRHVIGLSIAVAFGLGLLTSQRLGGHRSGRVVALAVAGLSLVLAYRLSRDEIRYAEILGYPVKNMVAAVQNASHGRPIGVAGLCNVCVCAYASNCTEIGPAQGYTSANQCALFEGPADIVVLRIEDGASAAAPCRTTGHRMLGRWPGSGMEVWARGANRSD